MTHLAHKQKTFSKKFLILIIVLCFLGAIVLTLVLIKAISQTSTSIESSNATTNSETISDTSKNPESTSNTSDEANSSSDTQPNPSTTEPTSTASTPATSTGNCTTTWGPLMLINYHFTVDQDFINTRKSQLINLTSTYGINELNSYNGVPLLDAEAAANLNQMLQAYQAASSGHIMKTVSCFRSAGTSCGRLCAATGTSDHHTGYTCDLIDPAYGSSLDTADLAGHPEWQWLKANSYKYGFIDRYPSNWAGSSMSEPLNVNENGSTGYYETWHYRYVGNPAATEIATGKYNNGEYDSLEHYLKATGKLQRLATGSCE